MVIIKKNIFLFFLCNLIAWCLLVVLFTWSPDDATFFSASTTQVHTQNMFGTCGAQLAAWLLFFWGISAFFLIPFFVYLAFFFVRKKKISFEWDAFLGWILLLFAGSSINALYHVSFFLPFSAGGYVGQYFLKLCPPGSDFFIIKLCMSTVLFISITLITRFSFITGARYIERLLRVLAYAERSIRPVVLFLCRMFSFLCASIFRALCAVCMFVHGLIKGKFIDQYGESIVNFEFGDVVEEILYEPSYKDVSQPFFEDNQQKGEDLYTQDSSPNEQGAQAVDTQKTYERVVKEKEPEVHTQALYKLPPERLFKKTAEKYGTDQEGQAEHHLAKVLEEKLARFGVVGNVVSIKSGPVITLFEYQPHIDAKISKIIALEDDLALALQAVSIRIIAPIPGKSVVGFEVAKKHRNNVLFSSIVYTAAFQENSGLLPLVFGHDTVGNTVIVDLATMPHLLVAGSTGSGKSVAMNVMLMSLLCKKTPQEMKLILIDPKRLEFAAYSDIGHLIFPIITEPKNTAPVLQWVVKTMEERYIKMAELGARNIVDYEALRKQDACIEQMPYIVVMIDEFADLMMVAGKEIEGLIARIAQMARAAGIHMILATQRPSVDVITGLIKVNFPSRISFRVTTKVDSRTILDCGGAEKLLGKGDMLCLDSSSASLRRVHGAYVSDAEITALVHFIRAQQAPQYLELKQIDAEQKGTLLEADDNLYKEIVTFIKTVDEISISLLQRRFRIGYNRSARIIEMLELEGYVLPSDGGKMRKVVH